MNKLTLQDIEAMTNDLLLDHFWYGDKLTREEADMIEDEIMKRGLDARPDGHLLKNLFIPNPPPLKFFRYKILHLVLLGL